jgi:signal transduction histidine kinase
MASPAPLSPLVDALRVLAPHDHLCSVYETQAEQFSIAVPFMKIGLERNEKCVYIADSDVLPSVRDAMHAGGINVDEAVRSGALTLTTKEQTYLRRGCFDPDWMFTFWEEAAEKAKTEGFTALRGTGETEWVLRGGPGLERWTEYESRLTDMLADANCLALCQYNWRLFPPELILDLIRTHPIVVYRGVVCRNFYYVPPHEFLGEDQPFREVERLLKNIREREQMDIAVGRQQRALQQAHDQLEFRVRERTEEIHDLNRELERRVAELSAMNEELEAFTYSVSHDLRTPLHHINGFAQLLAEQVGERTNPAAQRYLQRISEGSEQMGRLLDGLLALSRVGRQEITKRKADLNALLRDVLTEIEPETAGRDIQWQIGQLPVCECDDVLMRLVFHNLLSNAVKFTRPRTPAVIQVGQTEQDGRWLLFFRDNGVGFDMGSAGMLFGVFRRLHHQDDFEGLGLGLATVQRIVRKHGGEIWAEAEPDKGATFFFTLPAATGSA